MDGTRNRVLTCCPSGLHGLLAPMLAACLVANIGALDLCPPSEDIPQTEVVIMVDLAGESSDELQARTTARMLIEGLRIGASSTESR